MHNTGMYFLIFMGGGTSLFTALLNLINGLKCDLCQWKRLTYLWWVWKIKLREYLYAANKILVEKQRG